MPHLPEYDSYQPLTPTYSRISVAFSVILLTPILPKYICMIRQGDCNDKFTQNFHRRSDDTHSSQQ